MSQYDEFWVRNRKRIEAAIQNCADKGGTKTLKISDIKSYGDRKNWSASGILGVSHTNAAHGTSFFNIFSQVNNKPAPHISFSISGDGKTLTLTSKNSESPKAKSKNKRNKDGKQKASQDIETTNIYANIDISKLWKEMHSSKSPLFETAPESTTKAVFDKNGFYFSEETQKEYDKIKSSPHIYVAHNEDSYYIGISNQKGGRWKRSHYYHLGVLAHELLGTKKNNDQDHSDWIKKWFSGQKTCHGIDKHKINMPSTVYISFHKFHGISKKCLDHIETKLIQYAEQQGKTLLNRSKTTKKAKQMKALKKGFDMNKDIIVLPCTSGKNPCYTKLRYLNANGDEQCAYFVAQNPQINNGEHVPDSELPNGFNDRNSVPKEVTTWRELIDYLNQPRKRQHQLQQYLCPASELYVTQRTEYRNIYRALRQQIGANRLFIFSAGWGVVQSDFSLPLYNITFNGDKNESKHRNHTLDDCWVDLFQIHREYNGRIFLFCGKKYQDAFLRLCDRHKVDRERVVIPQKGNGQDSRTWFLETASQLLA